MRKTLHDRSPRRRRWLILLTGSAVTAVAALTSAAVWAAVSTADQAAPAALAKRVTISSSQPLTGVDPKESKLKGGQFVPASQRAKHRRGLLGAGDVVQAPLTGSLTPTAVESADGEMVIYSAWRQLAKIDYGAPGQGLQAGQELGTPSVRIYDATTGKDRLVERGAHAPALSHDGRVAFTRGDREEVRLNEPYLGKIVVGDPSVGDFEVWTSESARYVPYAWSGDTLLAYKSITGSEATDLYAFSGPDESRLIATEAFVIALSPDGSRVAAVVGRRMVEVLRVSDGAIEASMALDEADASTTGLRYLMYAGSWFGDRIAANSDRGLAILNVADGIRIESVIATPDFQYGIVEPTLIDDSHLVGWADLAGKGRSVGKGAEPQFDHALVSCDLVAASCAVGEASPALIWTRWIDNPSR